MQYQKRTAAGIQVCCAREPAGKILVDGACCGSVITSGDCDDAVYALSSAAAAMGNDNLADHGVSANRGTGAVDSGNHRCAAPAGRKAILSRAGAGRNGELVHGGAGLPERRSIYAFASPVDCCFCIHAGMDDCAGHRNHRAELCNKRDTVLGGADWTPAVLASGRIGDDQNDAV